MISELSEETLQKWEQWATITLKTYENSLILTSSTDYRKYDQQRILTLITAIRETREKLKIAEKALESIYDVDAFPTQVREIYGIVQVALSQIRSEPK